MAPTGTLPEQIKFLQADHYSLPLVKSFYKINGSRAQAPKGDFIYIATVNRTIVAALRLNPINSQYLLRSMCVSAALRHRGIGSALLHNLQNRLNDIECYSFPFTHLIDFYTQANFIEIETDLVPQAISDRYLRYINNGKKISLMKHLPHI